ncbi:MAG TPA: ferric reductase-like transmembrane domain-containing protein [Vicinamibacterales bacterium]
MPTAIDASSVAGLVALGAFTIQILLGLLLSVGYNPLRKWPRRRIKLFTLHNWLAYLALATALAHPLILLLSSTARFTLLDIVIPINAPAQAFESTLGALALYLVVVVVLTSYFRRLVAHHTWKLLHYLSYVAAAVFFVHGLLEDPNLKSLPIDWIDAEKVYIEGCAVLVAGATIARIKYRRGPRGVARHA